MPYTDKERKLLRGLIKQYGSKKGVSVYHAMLNSRKHDANFGDKSREKRGSA
jgi:hypothetical protein